MKTSFQSIVTTTALAGALIASVCVAKDSPKGSGPQSPVKSGFDAEFVQDASQGGMKEVELGTKAADKASAASVKRFASTMVSDHSKVNSELKELVSKKGWSIDASLNAKHQETVSKICAKSGADFDKEYLDEMISGHKKAVDRFEEVAAKGQDKDLKAFAEKTLPSLKHHLEQAEMLKKELK